jgi:hypothetical protein
MVSSIKCPGVFDGDKVIGAFYDAEDLSVSALILAYPTRFLIRQIKTDGTEADLFLHIQNRSGQSLSLCWTAP